MSWRTLLDERRVRPHQTSRQEIDALRAVVRRDLADARLSGLSVDRCFATAYNAALQIGKICIACEGYRVSGTGHHATTLEALELALGPSIEELVIYLDACRRKRNQIDYDMADVISETEAREVTERAEELFAIAEEWIRLNHPGLKR